MSDDTSGLKLAAERGITLGKVGDKILFENEHIRMWEVRLEPGQTVDFHIHYHPYLVVSLGGGENESKPSSVGRSRPTSRSDRSPSSMRCARSTG